jgi:hypothetical protein
MGKVGLEWKEKGAVGLDRFYMGHAYGILGKMCFRDSPWVETQGNKIGYAVPTAGNPTALGVSGFAFWCRDPFGVPDLLFFLKNKKIRCLESQPVPKQIPFGPVLRFLSNLFNHAACYDFANIYLI